MEVHEDVLLQTSILAGTYYVAHEPMVLQLPGLALCISQTQGFVSCDLHVHEAQLERELTTTAHIS